MVRQQLLHKYYMRALAPVYYGVDFYDNLMFLSNKMFIDFQNFWCCEVHVDGS